MKEFIYEIYLDKLDDGDNIIKLIDNLLPEEKKNFLEKLVKKCEFTKEEFFSNKDNKKIKLLCYLNEAKKLDINNIGKLPIILKEINVYIDEGLILKKNLEEFLNLKQKDNNEGEEKNENELLEIKTDKVIKEDNETMILQKLRLINIVINDYNPKKKYDELIQTIRDIDGIISQLNSIKNTLIIFHRNKYHKEITKIEDITNNSEDKAIELFRNQKMTDDITNLFKLKPICEAINEIKELLLFKKVYEYTQGKNTEERFNNTLDKLYSIKYTYIDNPHDLGIIFKDLENVFENIKEELIKQEESKVDVYLKEMIDFFHIDDISEQKNLKIIIKSKKYEVIIKSMKFFFDNFAKKRLSLPKYIELSTMKLKDLIKTLKKLKEDNIFDYESKGNYYKVYTSLYEKKEAIEFLLNKIDTNLNDLKAKFDPSIKIISIKDIDDANVCLNLFKSFINNKIPDIIRYIQNLDEGTIQKFVNYSNHYISIIELDRKE